jgi:large subunit ribosomal protein L29
MKATELLTLNKAELESKARDLKEELFNLRFQLATGQLQNTMVIKGVKRDIARVLTALRQLEQKNAE